ncbi:MAG: CbiX/SirB N-terminal domain-containing protein, partial [Candidatus Nanopelagicales bacterium]
MRPAVLLLAHGSPDVRHTKTIAAITTAVGRAIDVPVAHAFLEHHAPDASAAIRGLVARGGTALVTVPLLLSAAYHRESDVPHAVAEGTAAFPGLRTVIADVLAPDPRLARALQRRLVEASAAPDACVVLATAGARGEVASAQTAEVAASLARVRRAEVHAAAPSNVTQVLAAIGRPAAVVPYLLAPGVICDRIRDAARSG